jgi:hypothetical protein
VQSARAFIWSDAIERARVEGNDERSWPSSSWALDVAYTRQELSLDRRPTTARHRLAPAAGRRQPAFTPLPPDWTPSAKQHTAMGRDMAPCSY